VGTKAPLSLIPVLPHGGPDPANRLEGLLASLNEQEVCLECYMMAGRPAADLASTVLRSAGLMLQFHMRTSAPRYDGLDVLSAAPKSEFQIQIRARPGGLAAELLDPTNLMPAFDPHTMTFQLGFPEETLRQWAELGVLRPASVDRIRVCPRCQTLPTFRRGCRQCGSAHLANERLIHHFACAHVGRIADFECKGELICPKCRTRQLVVGSDYEYLAGPHRCLECNWTDDDLEDVAQCLRCGLRFPGRQAQELELRGYCADRLDLLALAQAS
jgi:hypothetical protein